MKGLVYGLALTGVAATAAYSEAARRRYLTWGATAAEVIARLPGDDLVADPDITSTRAVTIDAGPGSVGHLSSGSRNPSLSLSRVSTQWLSPPNSSTTHGSYTNVPNS